jgi:hypothetical protein
MKKLPESRTTSPYDLNAALKDQKAAEPQKSTRELSPYTLSHETSLRTVSAPPRRTT